VIPARLERATHSLEGCCSIQLSYGTNILSDKELHNLSRLVGVALFPKIFSAIGGIRFSRILVPQDGTGPAELRNRMTAAKLQLFSISTTITILVNHVSKKSNKPPCPYPAPNNYVCLRNSFNSFKIRRKNF
jgi:hypothetical protein